MVEHENKMTPYISIEGLSIGLCYESFQVNSTGLTSKAWKNQAQQDFQFCFSFFQKPGKSGSTRVNQAYQAFNATFVARVSRRSRGRKVGWIYSSSMTFKYLFIRWPTFPSVSYSFSSDQYYLNPVVIKTKFKNMTLVGIFVFCSVLSLRGSELAISECRLVKSS